MPFLTFYFALLLCLLLIGLFAASEAALAATNRVRLRHLLRAQNDGEDGATPTGGMDADAQRFIATVTVAANIPLLAAAAFSLCLATYRYGASWQTILVCGGVAIMTISLFQITPRLLVSQPGALERLWWIKPARLIVALLGPPVALMMNAGRLVLAPLGLAQSHAQREEAGPGDEAAHTEELRDLVQSAQDSGAIGEKGRELIESIFVFGDTRVHDVMTPRTEIVALSQDSEPERVLDSLQESGFSRLPLYEGDADSIVGILHIKDVLKQLGDENNLVASALMRAPLFLPESRKIDAALAEMRAARTHLAVVIDEFGGTAGLVTVEDILEELVGEIVDEHDTKTDEPLVILDESHAIVDARLHADDLKSDWDLALPTGEFDTVAGFMIEQLGRELAQDDVVELSHAELRVHSMREGRPEKILITKKGQSGED